VNAFVTGCSALVALHHTPTCRQPILSSRVALRLLERDAAPAKVSYLLGPIDTGPAVAWLEQHPELSLPRMVVTGSHNQAMTDEAVETFLEFIDDAMSRGENFSVLWDVRKESMPNMRQFRMVINFLQTDDRAAVWDRLVTSHFLVLRNPLIRGLMMVFNKIANAPQPVRFARSDAGAIAHASEAEAAYASSVAPSIEGNAHEPHHVKPHLMSRTAQTDNDNDPSAERTDNDNDPSAERDSGIAHHTNGTVDHDGMDVEEEVGLATSHERHHAPPDAVHESKSKPRARESLPVRINNTWYELSGWRAAHPSGVHWIDGYAHRDATEVMHAFHSKQATSMLARLPRLRHASPPSLPPTQPLTLQYRELVAELESSGWYRRIWWREAQSVAPTLALYAVGTWLARRRSLLATVLLALGSTSAGWVAHDYVHGRGKWCAAMRGFGAIFNGHSASWWSNKHNLHHACTNQVGVDEDIMSDPFFFLWAPDPSRDSQWRRLQHWYCLPVYSILFALWRFNSIRTVFSSNLRREGSMLALNYLWMAACLPASVASGHILLAGVITATIVTVSHQAEMLHHEHQHDWVRAQIESTRDAVTSNPFSEWLWGGMQYQLEHHLFPTMPRYRYPALVPRVRQLCEQHGMEYRVDGEAEIVARNFRLLSSVASAPPQLGAPSTRADTVWSRRRSAAWTAASTNSAASEPQNDRT